MPDLLLVVIIIGVAAHWVRYPTIARSHVYNPQMAHFYGAAPMALLAVGSGALLLGRDLIGERAVVDLEWMLWTVGTVGGLFTAMSIPYLMFTQINIEPDAAFGGCLMPVVPPMVSPRRAHCASRTWHRALDVVAYAGLLGAWGLVAVRTARGSLRGNLFLPPSTSGRSRRRRIRPRLHE